MAKDNYTEDDYPEYRSFPLYASLFGGIVISGIGLYLIITDKAANGFTSGGRLGTGGGNPTSINGISALVIGVLISLFPLYEIVKNSRKKK